jgi:hypothetical protein
MVPNTRLDFGMRIIVTICKINENPEPGQEGCAGFSTMLSTRLVGCCMITGI